MVKVVVLLVRGSELKAAMGIVGLVIQIIPLVVFHSGGAAAQAMMDRMRRLLMQEPMDPVVPGSIRMWANQEKVEMVFA